MSNKIIPVVQVRAELDYPEWLRGPQGENSVYIGEEEPVDPNLTV